MRAVTFSFTLFNNFNKFYFYINLVYEWPSQGGILPAKIGVSPFLINVYERNLGNLTKLTDILRLIFSLIMLILTLNNFNQAKKQLHETQRNMIEYLKIFLSAKMIVNIFIMLFYIICFALKLIYLMQNPEDLVKTFKADGFLNLNKFDFYEIKQNYETCIVIETIIVFFLFFRFIIFFYDLTRTNIFFIYIFKAFANVYVFLIILVMIIVSQAIFANNLWGQNFDEYRDLAGSIVNTLLFSIGHYQKSIMTSKNNKIWTIVFTVYFFFIVIYFFLSIFVGIFLESYRLNSLKNGYAYDLRLTAAIRSEDPDLNKKKRRAKNKM